MRNSSDTNRIVGRRGSYAAYMGTVTIIITWIGIRICTKIPVIDRIALPRCPVMIVSYAVSIRVRHVTANTGSIAVYLIVFTIANRGRPENYIVRLPGIKRN